MDVDNRVVRAWSRGGGRLGVKGGTGREGDICNTSNNKYLIFKKNMDNIFPSLNECEECLFFKENLLHQLDQGFLEPSSECSISHLIACLTRLKNT